MFYVKPMADIRLLMLSVTFVIHDLFVLFSVPCFSPPPTSKPQTILIKIAHSLPKLPIHHKLLQQNITDQLNRSRM